MKKALILSILCLVVLTFAGCAAEPATGIAQPAVPAVAADPVAPRLKVYATLYPLYYFAQTIGGARAEVTKLIPPGLSPHDWEPDPEALTALHGADLLIYNGLGLEPWLDRVVESLGATELVSVNTSEGIEPLTGNVDPCAVCNGEAKDVHGYDELADPHVWLDPILALEQARRIFEALQAADPESGQYFSQNFEALQSQFMQLDAEYREALQGKARDKFIVTHLSFAYLAKRYGLEQVGIAGLSPHAEPTASELAGLVELIRAHQIPYIFQEPLVSPRLAQVLATETGADILELNPLEGLLPEEIAAGENYFSVMRKNLAQLQRALQ